jgi:hypothetical protein
LCIPETGTGGSPFTDDKTGTQTVQNRDPTRHKTGTGGSPEVVIEEERTRGAPPRSRVDTRSAARPRDWREELRHYGDPEDNEYLYAPEPQPYCEDHPEGTTDKCWKCGEARRGHAEALREWIEDKSWRSEVFRQRVKIRDCHLCDDYGTRLDCKLSFQTASGKDVFGIVPCQHTPAANQKWLDELLARPNAPAVVPQAQADESPSAIPEEPPPKTCTEHPEWNGPPCVRCQSDKRAYQTWLNDSRRLLADPVSTSPLRIPLRRRRALTDFSASSA